MVVPAGMNLEILHKRVRQKELKNCNKRISKSTYTSMNDLKSLTFFLQWIFIIMKLSILQTLIYVSAVAVIVQFCTVKLFHHCHCWLEYCIQFIRSNHLATFFLKIPKIFDVLSTSISLVIVDQMEEAILCEKKDFLAKNGCDYNFL